MIGLHRMHEEGRRAGRGKRRGDLGADMAALAHAGDDDPAADRGNQLDGAGEGFGKAVLQRVGQRCDAGLLGGDCPERRRDRGASVRHFLHRHGMHGQRITPSGPFCPLY